MLIKASKVIGLPVFTVIDGKKIEQVNDVIYDPHNNKIEALIIEKGGWFSEPVVILYRDIAGIGEDAVLITGRDALKKVSEVEKNIETIAKNDTYLTNTKILTEKGVKLGKVSDVYFDTTTGLVEEFEVSQGSPANPKRDKKRVKISDIITVGKDATIVRVAPEEPQITPAKQPDSQIDDKGQKLEEKAQEEYLSARDKIVQQTRKLLEEVRSKTVDVPVAPVQHITDDGLKTPVETVKLESVQPVKKPLPENASLKNPQMVTENTRPVPQAEPKKPLMGAYSGDMKTKVSERRKRDAVGLYLTKNILTPDDTVLAKEGDMVTYRLLQEAEAAGVLDQILMNTAPKVAAMSL